ncbi:hypothetical protein ACWEQ7_18720 [Streptomyces sp. NPDC004069]
MPAVFDRAEFGVLPRRFAEDLAFLIKEVAGSQATRTTEVRNPTGHPPRTFDDFWADNLQPLRAVASLAS